MTTSVGQGYLDFVRRAAGLPGRRRRPRNHEQV
jgi:hypothetical protein